MFLFLFLSFPEFGDWASYIALAAMASFAAMLGYGVWIVRKRSCDCPWVDGQRKQFHLPGCHAGEKKR